MRTRVLISFFLVLILAMALFFWNRTHFRLNSTGGAPPASAVPHLAFSTPVEVLKLKPDADTALKNLSRNDAEFFHSWPILARHTVSAAAGSQLLALLNDSASYGAATEKCFEPEYAFRFGENTDALLSLKCGRIHLIVNRNAQVAALSPEGIQELKAWLQANFPQNSTAPTTK